MRRRCSSSAWNASPVEAVVDDLLQRYMSVVTKPAAVLVALPERADPARRYNACRDTRSGCSGA